MPDTVLRIDADMSQITVKFKKAGEELQKFGEGAAKSVGAVVPKLNLIPNALASVATALSLVGAAARATSDVLDRAKATAQSVNSSGISEQASIFRAGGNSQRNSAFITSRVQKFTTREGRADFLSQLGAIQDERRARGIPEISEKQINSMQDMYNQGGDTVMGHHGSDIIDSLRQFPMQPEVAIRRRLAGRLGVNEKGIATDALIKEHLRNLTPVATMALSQQQLAEQTANLRRDYENKSGQAVIAADEEFRQMQTQRAPGWRRWGAEMLPETAKRGEKVDDATKHLKAIRDGIMKMTNSGGNPTLPNLKARDDRGAASP